uniref:Uncharacterized protein n=1 Tax=Equus asinus TaxID=9793 RepID=A0A8C4MKL4_EQUAS
MPGRMKGKAGEWVAGGAPRAQRRPTAEVPGQLQKGTLCPHPARAPTSPGGPPPPPGSEGSRRTCPFRCGSLCPAWRQSWIAGFLFIRGKSEPPLPPSPSLSLSLLSLYKEPSSFSAHC